MLGALNEEQCFALLKRCSIGRIGCTDGDRVYVVPVTYAFDGKNIIGHTRPGMKIEFMRKHPGVCFEVDEMRSFADWESVIIWGQYSEIHDEEEKLHAMQFFIQSVLHLDISATAKWNDFPSKSFRPHTPGASEAIVFRIALGEISGRFESH